MLKQTEKIVAVPALKDNYIWLGINEDKKQAFAVDPGDASPVFNYLKKYQLDLSAILITHKHVDHTAGIADLADSFPGIKIYANKLENVVFANCFVDDGGIFTLSMWSTPFKVIHIPGHTFGHVAYYAAPALFSGDTLFSVGCGRVFEGTSAQMLSSLNKLAALPDDTLVYCGHEYTLSNILFASKVEKNNALLSKYLLETRKKRDAQQASLPSKMIIEKAINPFLRCQEKEVIEEAEAHTGHPLSDAISVFQTIREWKNNS